MVKGDKAISVCPNCGRKLEGPEFLTSVKSMGQQVALDFDPVAGRFLCPDCNYSGLPIEVGEAEYLDMKFEKKPISVPLARSNKFYWQMLALSIFLVLLGGFFIERFSGQAVAVIGCLILLYTMLRIPKYKK